LRAIADFAGGSPTIVHRAEGLLGQPLSTFLDLLSNDEPDAVLLVTQGSRNAEPLRSATQQALRLVEIDPAKAAFGLAGVCMLSQGLLSELCTAGASPPSMQLSPLVESIVSQGLSRPQVRVVSCWRAFTGDSMDLLAVNRSVLDDLNVHGPTPAEATNRIEGQVLIDPTATVSASVISGPVIIGAEAQIANSYIGPHTSIGERAFIEGAEIERSIVFSGARIMHVGGRLVASLVGRDARIFRDFSVPRAMRMHVGDGDEVALC
jgi:glucose-1-phosphate thymidylyltransferase